MAITPAEIAETRGMVEEQNLDIRTITMGVSLMGCGDENLDRMCTKIYDHVTHTAEHLVETAENLEREYGIPIVNKRVSVTPVAQIAACCKDEDLTPIAHALDRAAETLGIVAPPGGEETFGIVLGGEGRHGLGVAQEQKPFHETRNLASAARSKAAAVSLSMPSARRRVSTMRTSSGRTSRSHSATSSASQ